MLLRAPKPGFCALKGIKIAIGASHLRGRISMRAIASMSFDQSIADTESQIALLTMTEDAKEDLKALRRET